MLWFLIPESLVRFLVKRWVTPPPPFLPQRWFQKHILNYFRFRQIKPSQPVKPDDSVICILGEIEVNNYMQNKKMTKK